MIIKHIKKNLHGQEEMYIGTFFKYKITKFTDEIKSNNNKSLKMNDAFVHCTHAHTHTHTVKI